MMNKEIERRKLLKYLRHHLIYTLKETNPPKRYRVVIKSPFPHKQIKVVVKVMRDILDDSMRDDLVRKTAVAILRFYKVKKNDFIGAMKAIQRAVQLLNGDRFYVRDIAKIETFTTPKRQIINILKGDVQGSDCDDTAMLIASMLNSIGIPAEVVLIDAKNNGTISHAIARAINPATGKKYFLEGIVSRPFAWVPSHSKEIVVRPRYWRWKK